MFSCNSASLMRIMAISAFLFAGCAAVGAPVRFSSGPARVALIELYTSEGCSSCPPADQWLGSLKNQPGLWKEFVPMAFHVNYWDSLGWRDRLSTHDFTAREYAYASAWGSRSVYTPCFARNGTEWKPLWGGTNPVGGTAGVLAIEVSDDGACHVEFEPFPMTGTERDLYRVHVALLGGGISSKVTAGENDGRTLTHEFVVIGLAEKELLPGDMAGSLRADLPVPKPIVGDSKRLAIAAWVVRHGDLIPIQATGGWLR
jgi:hypothetical protein